MPIIEFLNAVVFMKDKCDFEADQIKAQNREHGY